MSLIQSTVVVKGRLPAITEITHCQKNSIMQVLASNILHCIVEIRANWVETKPFEVDNSRHHYQIA